jgi:type I restriction enzyme R subunit
VEIGNELANLPSQLIDTEEEAKRFDMLMLKTQICILNSDTGYDGLKATIQKIAAALELQDSIPAINKEMVLIQSIGTDEWWQDITVGMLESARKKLRLLVKLIEKSAKTVIYTRFDDEIGIESDVDLPLIPTGLDYEKFKSKTREFLRHHDDKLALQKLRRNMPITATDLQELEKILLEQASGNSTFIQQAREESNGLGLWVRSLVGLDRAAAVEAMAEFLNDTNATASQIEFAKMIVEYLTVDGAIAAERLYETPFTLVSTTGPDTVFGKVKVERLFAVIESIRQRAVA